MLSYVFFILFDIQAKSINELKIHHVAVKTLYDRKSKNKNINFGKPEFYDWVNKIKIWYKTLYIAMNE